MKFRKHFDYDVEKASNEACLPVSEYGESLTVQSQAEDADINVMVARFGITGQIPQGIRTPSYADFGEVFDYRSALHSVMDAQENFMRLDAKVRARFSNDPQEFVEFAEKPENLDEMRKMGLAPASPVVAPTPGGEAPPKAGAV